MSDAEKYWQENIKWVQSEQKNEICDILYFRPGVDVTGPAIEKYQTKYSDFYNIAMSKYILVVVAEENAGQGLRYLGFAADYLHGMHCFQGIKIDYKDISKVEIFRSQENAEGFLEKYVYTLVGLKAQSKKKLVVSITLKDGSVITDDTLYEICNVQSFVKFIREMTKDTESVSTPEHEKKDDVAKDMQATDKIKIPYKIDLFKGLDVGIIDNVFVETPFNLDPLVFLFNGEESSKPVGRFHGRVYKENESQTSKKVLVASSDDINFDGHESSRYFFLFSDAKNKNQYKVPVEVDLYETEEAKTHLCIDFGTSNTTVGCYLDEDYVSKVSKIAQSNGNVILNQENIVRFESSDPVSGNVEFKNIVPTMVYVVDCKNKDNIVYDFGYAASKRIEDDGFCPKASCFMELKRWTADVNKEENIQDIDGNKATVRRKDIIAKYLLYIIHSAENQFKCKFKNVHISTPVKLKGTVLEIYRDILKEAGYELEIKDAIDEGVAVLFSIIDTQIKEKRYEDGKEKKALIIDCGGGTSDLASCSYTITKDEDIVALDIKTEYMNGDVNFGGNNITYRIMQYLKIIYANYKRNSAKKIGVEEIISNDPNTIFSFIEGEMDTDSEKNVKERYDKVYQKLNELYDDAGKTIPTNFADYENKSPEEYKKVKNNFFFLWKLAEEMKKEFFRHSSIQRYRFNKNGENSSGDDDLHVRKVKDWKISYVDNSHNLVESRDFLDITFNKSDITTLLMADIYYLVRKFLNGLYEKNELNNYTRIKLSGQSTKIDIFTAALKEFLPGKAIRRNSSGDRNDSEELKLLCVRGAIMYLYAKEKANIEVKLTNMTNNIPVSVYVKTVEGEVSYMISQEKGWEQRAQGRRITDQGRMISLYLKNDKGVVTPCKYDYSDVHYIEKSPDVVEKESFGLIKQDDLNSLKPEKKKIFVYLDKERWGFNILPVYRKEEGGVMVGEKPKFYSFETDLLQEQFFDGRK